MTRTRPKSASRAVNTIAISAAAWCHRLEGWSVVSKMRMGSLSGMLNFNRSVRAVPA
ncbi:MAG: hypothetical protein H6704_01665 [Myxococcales bacterium]|nr:hypothetical protein [Myxococcales bacterium]MCB9534941.1 hypothetical protein [Myxococcales bacterium]